MTVANTASRWDYNGDGASTVFPYGNRIFAAGDLKVYVDGALKTLTTHYAVSGVDADGGGNVTFTAPPAAGTRNVVIVRDVPQTQATSYPANDLFPARSHERALDRLTILAQQLFARVSRAMRLADTSAYTGSLILPDAVAGKAIGWNATADGLTNDPADFTATIAAVAEQAGIATAQAVVATTQAGNATTQATASAASAAAADVAKIEWQGAWSGATVYAVHDAVQSFGTSYVCIQDRTMP